MKNIISRINKLKNKYPVKLVLSLALSVIVMFFVPNEFVILK